MKYINNGISAGLTQTAKDGQKASVDAIRSTFTVRGNWPNQNMKHGIKITPARGEKLQASVHTLADWLELHEKGGTKLPHGRSLSVPTFALRPKGSKKILRGPMRVKQLLASGKAFIMETDRGPVVAQTKGKGQRLVILYGLEPQVRVRKRSTFYEPIEKAVKRNIHSNVSRNVKIQLGRLAARTY